MNSIDLIATLDKSSIDSEGESTITLKIPLKYRDKTLELMKHTETPLIVRVTPSKSPLYKLTQLD